MGFPRIDLIKTGENITRLREKMGITRTQLSKLLFISYETVWSWENGKNCPHVDNLIAMKIVFNVTLDELVAIEGKKNEARVN